MTEWRECKLGDVIVLNYGKALPEKKRVFGNIPVYSSAGLTGYHNESLVNGRGIIIGRKGTIGSVHFSYKPFWCIDTAYYITDNEEYNLKYIYYLLQTLGLNELNEDSAVPGLNRNTAYQQDISFPPLPEQKAIAEFLSSLDDKIDLLTRQNKTLEDLAQTYFRKWFLEENDNDTIMVSEIAKLENNSVSPKRQPLEPFHHYSIPAYDNAQTPVVELGNTILSNKFTVQPNSILVSKLNPITPRIWRIDENVMPNSVCSTEFQVLKPYDIKHYLFLYFLMKSDDVVSSFAMSATGTSGSHQRIRPEYILEVETPEPDNDKLILFNEICTPMMERVKKNQQQIITLQKLRDTLLPKLISGEVRVKQ